MSCFGKKMVEVVGTSSACGTLGASIGGSAVSAVCAIGGSVFGPVGTFFGAQVGTAAGAAVGGFIGSCVGAVGELLSE